MNETKLMYDIHEMPPMKKSIVLAFQHLFAMFGATILVPILVNAAAGEEVLTIPVALVTSGIGTLNFAECNEILLDENLAGYCLMYTATHGSDDYIGDET